MDLRPLARAERTDLATFLATLTEQEWEAPSLCEGWRVRDVVAHLISYEELSGRELVERLAKGWFVPDRINAIGLADHRDLDPEALLAALNRNLDPRGFTALFGGMIALVDGLIHHQDIRRALGKPRQIPAERLLRTLSCALYAPLLRGFWRVRGLHLVATDVNWSTGHGPEVLGPGEPLLMAMAGRHGVVAELSGPGTTTLASRIEG
jgi:uncharacterized protein (TIGR03083 family)